MTTDFVANVHPILPHVQHTTDRNSAVINDMHLSFYPISGKYLLDNKNSINSNDWLVIDSISGKFRPPRQNEFLLLLLENPLYSSYISWTNKSEGLCKIHQPHQISSLWAKVKNRYTTGTMNYDVFARGIRFYYKSGLMIKTNKKHTLRFKLPLHRTSI